MPRPRHPHYRAARPASRRFWLGVEKHGELYATEWGYNVEFEGLVADIVGKFIAKLRRAVGESVDCRGGRRARRLRLRRAPVRDGRQAALADPHTGRARARAGGRLTTNALRSHARKAIAKLVLWTQSHLLAARAIYESRGFLKVKAERNDAFGKHLTSETWELKLSTAR